MRARTTAKGLVIRLHIDPAPKAAITVPLVSPPPWYPIAFFKASNLKEREDVYVVKTRRVKIFSLEHLLLPQILNFGTNVKGPKKFSSKIQIGGKNCSNEIFLT